MKNLNVNELEKIYFMIQINFKYQNKQRIKKIFNFKINCIKNIFLFLSYLDIDTNQVFKSYKEILLKDRIQDKNVLSLIENKDKELFDKLNKLLENNEGKNFLNFEDFLILDEMKFNEKINFKKYFKEERRLSDKKMSEWCSKIVEQHNKERYLKNNEYKLKNKDGKKQREYFIDKESDIRVIEL